MYKTSGKRIFDFVVSLTVLILLFPLLFVIAAFISFSQKGTPFFFQDRPGYREKIFTIIKFRTMLNQRDQYGELLPDEERITAHGRFLRKYALDELPQLWNVLVGEMSLIGPRPLLKDYLSLYNDVQRKRHHVLPGITGWAQIQGRNNVGWEQKFELDVWYVENFSFAVDLRILLFTLTKIGSANLSRPSATSSPEKFKG